MSLVIVQTLTTKDCMQRTANEYAGERRIYKDLISKNEKQTYKILQAEYCNADRTT